MLNLVFFPLRVIHGQQNKRAAYSVLMRIINSNLEQFNTCHLS